MKVSIIIVHYNVASLLRKCLQSLARYAQDVSREVIVVDNQSPDAEWKDLIKEFPDVRFIEAEKNAGFAVANNLAAKEARGEYLLLLNPDTEFEGYYLNEILDFADGKPRFGALGVRMHDSQGRFLPESKRSVPDMFNSFQKLFAGLSRNKNRKTYYRNDIGEFEIAPVEVLTGAFLLMKTNVYLEVGGLDETYFMYGEDIDLCYTLLQKNYTNWYYGKVSILHHKGESTVKDHTYLERFYGAMQIFVDKYYKTKTIQHAFLSAGLKLRHRIELRRYQKK